MPEALDSSYVDVLIVGAGLSGIGMAWHLKDKCPDRSFKIVEARQSIGGTWDLFRYPGIRSDSDMHTLGYRFKPWTKAKAIADGPSILEYVKETARENDIEKHIEFGRKVVSADWNSETDTWMVVLENSATGERINQQCRFLMMCSGYYRYETGYTPEFEGVEGFKGHFFHPQNWPEDLDYSDKKVVVIGSGATAVTIVPVMAETAEHVTMLQRSPTYMVSRPSEDGFANFLRRILPVKSAYTITRWRNILMQRLFYGLTRSHPSLVKKRLLKSVRDELGTAYDIDTHFTPKYNPWDERVCLVPDSDIFEAIRNQQASVVTDTIDHFTETGIQLKSGEHLEADIVVSATGLDLSFLGDVAFQVDGTRINSGDLFYYKSLMFSGIPNLASIFGYLNASWTLKVDISADYVCRLLNEMERRGASSVTPTIGDDALTAEPWANFSSGYIQRKIDELPKQADREPWRNPQDYLKDRATLRNSKLDDGVLKFKIRKEAPSQSSKDSPVELDAVVAD